MPATLPLSPLRARLIRSVAEEVPAVPGVYHFRGKGGRSLYIGKSINLRRRMLEHLRGRSDERTLAQRMASEIVEFSYTETGTELLALLLEDRLIKREYPEYNVRQREYREYRYLCLTDEEFPNLRVVRNLEEAPDGQLFGPFRDLYFATELKQISEDLLHLRACSDAEPARKSPRYDLGRCPGPCRGKISPDDYAPIVERVRAFLDGDASFVTAALARAMGAAAAAGKYELAGRWKDRADFLRRFCARQEFLRGFREEELTLRDRKDQRTYFFRQGNLTSVTAPESAAADAAALPEFFRAASPAADPAEGEDTRFLSDRGHLVYDWILRHREQCEVRLEAS